MKKRGRSALILAGGTICAVLVHAQAGTSQHSVQNLATISFGAAVMQTNEAKHDFAALQTKFAPREAQIQTLNHEIDGLRKQLNDQKDHLSDTELNARTQALNVKQKQLQRAEEDYRNDSQSDGQEAFRKIAQKVFSFLQDYAKEHEYIVVFNRGDEDTPLVLYAIDSADITAQVVAAYNAQTRVASAPQGSSTERTPPSQPRP